MALQKLSPMFKQWWACECHIPQVPRASIHCTTLWTYFQFLLLLLIDGSLPSAYHYFQNYSLLSVKFSTGFATKQFVHPLHNRELPHRNSCTAKNTFVQFSPQPTHSPSCIWVGLWSEFSSMDVSWSKVSDLWPVMFRKCIYCHLLDEENFKDLTYDWSFYNLESWLFL